MKNLKKNQGGFTLIEILVVIGIIAVLAAVVLIAINPARQFAQANDSQRTSNLNAILNAVGQYMADHAGELPPGIDDAWADIDDNLGDGTETFCEVIVPTYMPALPADPTAEDGPVDDCSSTFNTEYEIMQDAETSRISVRAFAQLDQNDDGEVDTDDVIVVTR